MCLDGLVYGCTYPALKHCIIVLQWTADRNIINDFDTVGACGLVVSSG